jgi:chromosome segregation ATPase
MPNAKNPAPKEISWTWKFFQSKSTQTSTQPRPLLVRTPSSSSSVAQSINIGNSTSVYDLEQSLAIHKRFVVELSTKCTTLEEELALLQSEDAGHLRNIQVLQTDLQDYRGQIAKLNEYIRSLEDNLVEFETITEDKENEVSSKVVEIDTLKTIIEDLQAQLNIAKIEIAAKAASKQARDNAKEYKNNKPYVRVDPFDQRKQSPYPEGPRLNEWVPVPVHTLDKRKQALNHSELELAELQEFFQTKLDEQHELIQDLQVQLDGLEFRTSGTSVVPEFPGMLPVHNAQREVLKKERLQEVQAQMIVAKKRKSAFEALKRKYETSHSVNAKLEAEHAAALAAKDAKIAQQAQQIEEMQRALPSQKALNEFISAISVRDGEIEYLKRMLAIRDQEKEEEEPLLKYELSFENSSDSSVAYSSLVANESSVADKTSVAEAELEAIDACLIPLPSTPESSPAWLVVDEQEEVDVEDSDNEERLIEVTSDIFDHTFGDYHSPASLVIDEQGEIDGEESDDEERLMGVTSDIFDHIMGDYHSFLRGL